MTNLSLESDIKVSVCVVTYNQEKFIAECLDSLIQQETSFRFEIIVGEDCSTDGTRAIVQQYVDKYPHLIVPLFYEQNVGPVENIKRVYKKARGKYIAHMDGDDMALPEKLQKQYDALEKNPDCSICAHNMLAIDRYSKKTKPVFKIFSQGKYRLLDLYLINPFFIHSSKMFVNNISLYVDELDCHALDLEVHIRQAEHGDILFLADNLGCYRQYTGVTYIENKEINPLIPKRIINIYETVNWEKFNTTDRNKIRTKYTYVLLQYAAHYLQLKKYKEANEYYLKAKQNKYRALLTCFFYLFFMAPCLIVHVKKVKNIVRDFYELLKI